MNVKYSWDKWLGRKTAFTLVEGRDFCCRPYSMMIMLRNAAKKRGKRVKVTITDVPTGGVVSRSTLKVKVLDHA